MGSTLRWKQHHLHSVYMRVQWTKCKRQQFFFLCTLNKKQIENCRALCILTKLVIILNSAADFQYCISLAKETGSLTHSEDEDREAAFHSHYGCDSELGTKCPLSNSLQNLKKAQSCKYSRAHATTQNVSSHPPQTPTHEHTHTVWARRSRRDRIAVQQ